MKTLLATTAVLAVSAGMASAEISLSGSARMGIIDDFGDTGAVFSSRVRIVFTASGETDTGLSFGASMRADQNGGNADGTANDDSTVYISGSFGKLTMGDVDGAAAAAVGQVDGVGYTGLSDLNEIAYLLGNEDTSALYEYSAGNIGLYFSGQPNEGNTNFGVGANYTMGNYKFGIGYEKLEDDSTPGGGWPDKIGFSSFFGNGATQVVLGADATFGSLTVKGRFARYDEANIDAGVDQAALSLTYSVDALALTGYYSNYRGTESYQGDDGDFYGIGASYDLGGGAKVMGGYVAADTTDSGKDDALDIGLSFSF